MTPDTQATSAFLNIYFLIHIFLKIFLASFPLIIFLAIPSNIYTLYTTLPLHSCDYLNKISIKANVATDEGNSRNEM